MRPHVQRAPWRSRPRRLTVFLAGVALFDVVIWTALALAR